eukprot:6216742-Amphidinium_carterae.2
MSQGKGNKGAGYQKYMAAFAADYKEYMQERYPIELRVTLLPPTRFDLPCCISRTALFLLFDGPECSTYLHNIVTQFRSRE